MTDLVHNANIVDAGGEVLVQIDRLIEKLQAAESCLEHGYAGLGILLNEVSEKEYWRDAQHKSFNDYIKDLGARYHRGRTQLYNYFSTVKELRPYLSEEKLNEIGISKARELKTATQRSGFPASEIIDAATKSTTTVEDVRKLLFEAGNPSEKLDGNYHDLGSVLASKEEWGAISKAFSLAEHIGDPIGQGVSQPVRLKEILLRMSQECIGTWEPMLKEEEK